MQFFLRFGRQAQLAGVQPDQSLLHSEACITGSFTISCGNPERHYSQDTSHALPDSGNASVDDISRGL
jgi:hypothetical protein